MRLYSVRTYVDIVVYAENEDQASRIALAERNPELRHASTEPVKPIVTADDLPAGWDLGSLPYGRDDDVSVGEILGKSEVTQ